MSAVATVTFKGLRAHCTAYASDEGGTVLLSLVGSTTVLNGLWAAFLSHEVLLVNEQTPLRRMQRADEGQIKTLAQKPPSEYRTLNARLRESGKRHTLIVHQQATPACELDRTFYVLQRDQTPPLERFFRQFTRAVAVCARPAWGAYLWQRGLEAHLIRPCASRGVEAWWVSADAAPWSVLVRAGILSGQVDSGGAPSQAVSVPSDDELFSPPVVDREPAMTIGREVSL